VSQHHYYTLLGKRFLMAKYIIPFHIRGAYQCRESQKMTNVKTDPNLLALINALKAETRSSGVGIWRDIALRLEKAKANWAEVNLSKLERNASEGDIVVVPGKVLGSGALNKKLTVAAYGFSESAKMKIEAAGGRNLTITELVKEMPKGTGVKIMR
jgi:large subunit ribosomal protein L18e